MASFQIAPPQPAPDPGTKPYWDHAAKGELALPRCETCGAWHAQPIEFCRKCGGKFAYRTVSGEGTIYSYLIQHHLLAPGFEEALPYVIALVSPQEAPDLRLVTRLVDVDPVAVRVGQRVKAKFVDHPGGSFKLPVFAPMD
jgi:uncharacterized OB-fold protein